MKKISKKQADRKARIFPFGKPKYVRCYDNGGETADRYTVVFTGMYTHNTGGEHWYLGMSEQPFHPQGIEQHGSNSTQIDKPAYSHLGKKVTYDSLPNEVKQCVCQTYLYLWNFTDENGKRI